LLLPSIEGNVPAFRVVLVFMMRLTLAAQGIAAYM
jgi:hypothetical protein